MFLWLMISLGLGIMFSSELLVFTAYVIGIVAIGNEFMNRGDK